MLYGKLVKDRNVYIINYHLYHQIIIMYCHHHSFTINIYKYGKRICKRTILGVDLTLLNLFLGLLKKWYQFHGIKSTTTGQKFGEISLYGPCETEETVKLIINQ